MESALTTETPTPCRPPDTLYALLSNFPPACRVVMTSSTPDFLYFLCVAVGIPLPSSITDAVPSLFKKTWIFLLYPANASSIELSTTSYTR